jgi:hypothetical protein
MRLNLSKQVKLFSLITLVGALSSCILQDDNYGSSNMPQSPATYDTNSKPVTTPSSTNVHTHKSATSGQPVQKTTPGPKRAAAPQLPVIQ